MRRYGSKLSCVLLLWWITFAPAPAMPASTSPSPAAPAYDRAIEALKTENFREALTFMQTAILENPQNLEFQYTLGGIYLRLHRFDEAEAIFLALLRENEGQYRKAYFELTAIAMDRGKFQEALDMLAKARPVDPGRADLEAGQIHMRLKNYSKAVALFDSARAANPSLAPQAMTQKSIALFNMGKLDESKATIKSLLAMELPPETAAEVRRLLTSVEDAIRVKKPWSINVLTGFQYDSNPLQNPLNSFPGNPTNREDGAHLFSLTGRYNLYQDEAWKAGVGYNQYFLTYFRSSDISLIGARPSLYLQYEHKPYYAGLQYIYSHYWVGGKSHVDVHSIFPTFTLVSGEHWRTETYTGIDWTLYEDQTPNYRHYFVGLTEMYMMKGGRAHVRAGYRFEYEDLVPEASGTFGQHVMMLGVQYPLFRTKWFADLSGQYIRRNFEFAPVISNQMKRHDDEEDLTLQISGPINSFMALTLMVQQVWNNSNITSQGVDPYNYRRTILSCMVTANF